eukprot:scaffold10008_cov73-Isochrysis_galbana.AAC.1
MGHCTYGRRPLSTVTNRETGALYFCALYFCALYFCTMCFRAGYMGCAILKCTDGRRPNTLTPVECPAFPPLPPHPAPQP